MLPRSQPVVQGDRDVLDVATLLEPPGGPHMPIPDSVRVASSGLDEQGSADQIVDLESVLPLDTPHEQAACLHLPQQAVSIVPVGQSGGQRRAQGCDDADVEEIGATAGLATLGVLGALEALGALGVIGCWNGRNAASGNVRSATMTAVMRVPLLVSVCLSKRGSRIASIRPSNSDRRAIANAAKAGAARSWLGMPIERTISRSSPA